MSTVLAVVLLTTACSGSRWLGPTCQDGSVRSERIGSLIGAVGGLAFVLVNAQPLPDPWAWLLPGAGVLLFLAVLALVVVRPARPGAEQPPSRRQVRGYGLSVTAMVVAIVVGARLLALAGLGELTVLWVVLAVGAHFVPFARLFDRPFFAVLGWSLVALAGLGAAGVLLLRDAALAGGVAVLAGFVLLGSALLPAVTARTVRARG